MCVITHLGIVLISYTFMARVNKRKGEIFGTQRTSIMNEFIKSFDHKGLRQEHDIIGKVHYVTGLQAFNYGQVC